MRIRSISLYHFDKPFVIGFNSPHRLRNKADSLIVKFEFEEGLSGYGESVPRPYVTGETCSSAAGIIRDVFSGLLFKAEFNNLEDASDILEKIETVCRSKSIPAYNSALGAVDIALIDALGKLLKKPARDFLGPAARKEIPCAVSIPFLSPAEYQYAAEELKKMPFDSFKIILGADEEENRNRLRLIRTVLGDKKDLRAEANGKWSREQALSNIQMLKEFNVSGIEQPLPKGDLEGMRQIRKRTGMSIIADESLCSLEDAVRLIEKEACDILNIKISKCGGLLRSWQIVQLAESRGVLCQLGSHVGETEILSYAGRHLAAAVRNLTYFENGSHLLFEKNWDYSRTDFLALPFGNGLCNPGLALPREYVVISP